MHDLTFLSLLRIVRYNLHRQIEFYKDTALPLYFTNFKYQNNTIESSLATNNIDLFKATTGQINIGRNFINEG